MQQLYHTFLRNNSVLQHFAERNLRFFTFNVALQQKKRQNKRSAHADPLLCHLDMSFSLRLPLPSICFTCGTSDNAMPAITPNATPITNFLIISSCGTLVVCALPKRLCKVKRKTHVMPLTNAQHCYKIRKPSNLTARSYLTVAVASSSNIGKSVFLHIAPSRKEEVIQMITIETLIQFSIFVVSLVGCIFAICNKKK